MNIITSLFKVILLIFNLGIIISFIIFIFVFKPNDTYNINESIKTELQKRDNVIKDLKNEILYLKEFNNDRNKLVNPLPQFKLNDYKKKQLKLYRIFSVRDGYCFDINGDMSCFYKKVKIGENNYGFILYKANRMFTDGANLPAIIDKTGNKVELLTSIQVHEIIQWERDNPNGSINMSFHE